MSSPDDLAFEVGAALRKTGPDSDVVLTSRIRLARNVEGHAFPHRLDRGLQRELEHRLGEWLAEARIAPDLRYWNLGRLSPLQRQVFMERHLISRELVAAEGERGVAIAPQQLLAVMTNEEDHLRIQTIRPGRALGEAWRAAREIDRRLERTVPYAFDDRYGYLTACPTNTGTGLRVSVMCHLPALSIGGQVEKLVQAANKLGLAVRGYYGEGTKALGDVIQISNQRTLGLDESQIIDNVRGFLTKLLEWERGARDRLLERDRTAIEDRIWRAVGTLRYARRLRSEETMEALSAARLGITLNILPGMSLSEINECFAVTQPAHLQVLEARSLSAPDRDTARASLLRRVFGAEAN